MNLISGAFEQLGEELPRRLLRAQTEPAQRMRPRRQTSGERLRDVSASAKDPDTSYVYSHGARLATHLDFTGHAILARESTALIHHIIADLDHAGALLLAAALPGAAPGSALWQDETGPNQH